jgi:hypothetical protein
MCRQLKGSRRIRAAAGNIFPENQTKAPKPVANTTSAPAIYHAVAISPNAICQSRKQAMRCKAGTERRVCATFAFY